MIDLHTHTILSDGELIASELAKRAKEKGYKAIAITDHADSSNMETVVRGLVTVAKDLNEWGSIKVIPGVEITHVPVKGIAELVKKSRELGAKIVLVHGETMVEPVAKGTNKAAIEAGADILTHPGLITSGDVKLAKDKGVYLEITSRKGHSLSNGHVAGLALQYGAKLVFSTDAHGPDDLVTDETARKVLLGSGINVNELDNIFKNNAEVVKRALGKGYPA